MVEPSVRAMEHRPVSGLPIYAIPPEWLPIPLRSWPDPYDPEAVSLSPLTTCGYWLCENEQAHELIPGEHRHVLYCSLPYGHQDGHVWQNPTPRPSRSDASRPGSATEPAPVNARGVVETVTRPRDQSREELFGT